MTIKKCIISGFLSEKSRQKSYKIKKELTIKLTTKEKTYSVCGT